MPPMAGSAVISAWRQAHRRKVRHPGTVNFGHGGKPRPSRAGLSHEGSTGAIMARLYLMDYDKQPLIVSNDEGVGLNSPNKRLDRACIRFWSGGVPR